MARQENLTDIRTGCAYIEENKMLRVAIISKLGNPFSLTAETREEIDVFLLDIDSKEGLKLYRIIDKATGEVLETQDGVKSK